MILRTHLSVVMVCHSWRNGNSLVVHKELGEMLTPVLSFAKRLIGAAKALLFEQWSGGLLSLISPVLLLFAVPKELVLSGRLVLRLLVCLFLGPIWLVWCVRLCCLSHLIDIFHDFVSYGVE